VDEPSGQPPALPLDLDDFDAVGVATDVVATLRRHAIEHELDAVATVAAPAGYQRVTVTGRPSGHVVLGVRFGDLGRARRNNLVPALADRGWLTDEDGDGATRRFPPGTEPTDAAFELLAVVTLVGAPAGVRSVSAIDAGGEPVDLA
jgi:hypothetical protein